MKRSLRTRLVIIFAGMLILTIGVIYLANIVLLPSWIGCEVIQMLAFILFRSVSIRGRVISLNWGMSIRWIQTVCSR